MAIFLTDCYSGKLKVYFKMMYVLGAGEMVQELRTLASLVEDLSLDSSIHPG